MLGLAGGVLFKDELSRGPHIPNHIRNAKTRNIMPVYLLLRRHEWSKTPSKRPSLPPIAKYIGVLRYIRYIVIFQQQVPTWNDLHLHLQLTRL